MYRDISLNFFLPQERALHCVPFASWLECNADDLHMDTTDRCLYPDLGTNTEMSNSVLAPFDFHYWQQMEKGVPLRLILNIIKEIRL